MEIEDTFFFFLRKPDTLNNTLLRLYSQTVVAPAEAAVNVYLYINIFYARLGETNIDGETRIQCRKISSLI